MTKKIRPREPSRPRKNRTPGRPSGTPGPKTKFEGGFKKKDSLKTGKVQHG